VKYATALRLGTTDPIPGNFTSTDPIPGGNNNPYTYPVDPQNSSDPSGAIEDCDNGLIRRGQCIERLSKQVERWANSTWRGTKQYKSNLREAARHFVWNVLLIQRIGTTATRAVVGAHEIGRPPQKGTWNLC